MFTGQRSQGVGMKLTTASVVLLIASVALTPGAARAATRGTPSEAKVMLDKAVDHLKSAGRKVAITDFNASKAPFRDRDLYVLCVDSKHSIVANGGYPSYVGTSVDAFVDEKGVTLGKALWDAARKNANGFIVYLHLNPVTRRIEEKTTFYSKVADDLLCGVGAYSAR